MTKTTPTKHAYEPNKKHPQFCDMCGYPEHEYLQHFRPEELTEAFFSMEGPHD